MATPRYSAAVATRGFTLIEVMTATLLSGLVLAGVLASSLQLMRSGVRIVQYAEMSSQVRSGLEQLGRDLKIANAIKWNSVSDLTLSLPTTSGTTTQVTYAWTSASQSLFLVPGADSTVTPGRIFLVRGIPPLADGSAGATFARYDRAGNTATTDAMTKRVQIILNVRRQTDRTAASTGTAVSASFILRNKPVS